MDDGQQHLNEQQVEQFRLRRMSASEKALWERHLAACHDCLDRVYGDRDPSVVPDRLVEALLLAEEEGFHLSMPELQQYSSGSMDEADRTIFESHLEGCAACRSQAEALVNARNPVPKEIASERHGWAHFWRRPAFGWPARVAVAAVLLVFLVFFWGTWRHKNTSTDQLAQKAGSDRSIVLRLQDGNTEVTLDKDGTLAGLERLEPTERNAVRDALASATLSKPQVLSDLTEPAIKLMGKSGGAPQFGLVSPVATVVAEEQPTLRWQPLRGASAYSVAIFDPQFRPVARSPFQPGTEWRVSVPLRPGKTYFWQVTARKGSKQITVPAAPAPRAEFRVLNSEAAADLQRVRALAPDSHLALGILYAREGLRLDAERELEELVKENSQSQLPAKLLSDVRSWGPQKPSPTTTNPAQ